MFKRLLLTSTTIVCFTVMADSRDALTETMPANAKHGSSKDANRKMMEIPDAQPIPSVNLIVHPDSMRGYNLEVQVTNFKFAPENVNTAARPGEGHAHLYVNGKKIARLYGNWYYLENLQPGKNKITVSLNANSHEVLARNGKIIQDTEIVQVPAP